MHDRSNSDSKTRGMTHQLRFERSATGSARRRKRRSAHWHCSGGTASPKHCIVGRLNPDTTCRKTACVQHDCRDHVCSFRHRREFDVNKFLLLLFVHADHNLNELRSQQAARRHLVKQPGALRKGENPESKSKFQFGSLPGPPGACIRLDHPQPA